jgi:hypothetical protein
VVLEVRGENIFSQLRFRHTAPISDDKSQNSERVPILKALAKVNQNGVILHQLTWNFSVVEAAEFYIKVGNFEDNGL